MYREAQRALQAELINNTQITALLSDYDGNAMIINDTLCPHEWGLEESTLNYYRSFQDDFSCYDDVTFVCNCRAYSMRSSEDIANTIKDELHEKTANGFMFVVEFVGTINPASEVDNYNTVVNINVRQK